MRQKHYNSTPIPWTDLDFIWRDTSHNHPETTAKISSSVFSFYDYLWLPGTYKHNLLCKIIGSLKNKYN